jgi:ribonuclease E
VVIDDRGPLRGGARLRGLVIAGAGRPGRATTRRRPLPLFERTTCTSSCTRRSTARCGCPRAARSSSSTPRRSPSSTSTPARTSARRNLEETVFRNNLEAAEEIARQLRLRDIGGIIVIDFIDMEIKSNRDEVVRAFREALARDKTRTQVFDISELGLVEMTRKRIGEGLLESEVSCARAPRRR